MTAHIIDPTRALATPLCGSEAGTCVDPERAQCPACLRIYRHRVLDDAFADVREAVPERTRRLIDATGNEVPLHALADGGVGTLCGEQGFALSTPGPVTCERCRIFDYNRRAFIDEARNPEKRIAPSLTLRPVHRDLPRPTWWQRRRFLRAYRILHGIAERHRAANHDVEFTAVSENLISLRCLTCAPEPIEQRGPR